MNDPSSARIFLSSTFRDLKAERRAVEQIIHRMGDYFSGMEHFGASPNTPLEKCLAEVRRADVVVLVLGFRHGSVPRGKKRSMVEREYFEAHDNCIPVLPYVTDRIAYHQAGDAVENPRLVAFRKLLRERHNAPCFKSKDDLAAQVAADVGRHLRLVNARFHEDAHGGLVGRHNEVITAIRAGELQRARKLNEKILDDVRTSPRAHYNQACILSVLAGGTGSLAEKVDLLFLARRRLYDALKFGILTLIGVFADRLPENGDPAGRVNSDPDLRPLFDQWPSLKDEVRAGAIQPSTKGCTC